MVRAVFFDAVGTLIHPDPPAHVAYARIGRQFGSRFTEDEVRLRFRSAFARQEQLDLHQGLRTSEERERERWRQIVAEVLADAVDVEACFHELHAHFARPDAWDCDRDAAETISELVSRDYTVGLASNYDARLRTVVAGLPGLAGSAVQVISSEIGWRKPALEFFEVACRLVNLQPAELLLVGDDLVNDFEGSRAAGWHALLFDPKGNSPDVEPRIRRLNEILMHLE